jgi:hypothetical protein
MAQERRNLYRILHVQPEAPQQVIKASYRALMVSLHAHPDHGGNHEEAAALNAAYAILGDPERRAAYDRSLQRQPRQTAALAAPARTFDPQDWLLQRRCPMCATAFVLPTLQDACCGRCASPLTPAPGSESAGAELLGRRHGGRFARGQDVQLLLPNGPEPLPARVKDLSLTGLALQCRHPVPSGAAMRVMASGFDAVAVVVATRPMGSGCTVHGRLLTLKVLRSSAGTFVSMKV